MEEVIQFLRDHKVFYLATSQGDQPRVRPMGFVMDYEGKLSFCTNNKKEMFKQMKANPKVEISAAAPDGKTLRITGVVGFNPSMDAKVKALEIMPELKSMYAPGDGVFEVFHIEKGAAVFIETSGEKREITL
jgi:uncharacterized pyridoxamine 5'-phosphate oxidase family protein